MPAVSATIWIDAVALRAIRQHAVGRRNTETGGALIGYEHDDEIVVACAYGPGPRARHRRTTFQPHRRTTQAVIDAVSECSRGRYRFLGSWHTHPGGEARPSGIDIASLEAMANQPDVRLARPIMLIQATRAHRGGVVASEMRAWTWDQATRWALPAALLEVGLEAPSCPVVSLEMIARKPTSLDPAGPERSGT